MNVAEAIACAGRRLPRPPVGHFPYGCLGDAELVSQGALTDPSGFVPGPKPVGVLLGEDCVAMVFATRSAVGIASGPVLVSPLNAFGVLGGPMATTFNHVSRVFGARSGNDVRRVAARRVVTPVAQEGSGVYSVDQFPRHTVSTSRLADATPPAVEDAVSAVFGSGSAPGPARGGTCRLVDLGPEPCDISIRQGKSIHA